LYGGVHYGVQDIDLDVIFLFIWDADFTGRGSVVLVGGGGGAICHNEIGLTYSILLHICLAININVFLLINKQVYICLA